MQGQNAEKAELSHKDKMTLALLKHVQPTHFITLSLCQARKVSAQGGVTAWIRGDDTIYQNAHASFIKSLSKRLVSRSVWVRHKPIIASAGAIEGGIAGQRYHLHLLVAKPEHVTEERFRMAVCDAAAGHPWIMSGNYAVDIQSLANDRDALNAAYYSVKRGVDRICL